MTNGTDQLQLVD